MKKPLSAVLNEVLASNKSNEVLAGDNKLKVLKNPNLLKQIQKLFEVLIEDSDDASEYINFIMEFDNLLQKFSVKKVTDEDVERLKRDIAEDVQPVKSKKTKAKNSKVEDSYDEEDDGEALEYDDEEGGYGDDGEDDSIDEVIVSSQRPLTLEQSLKRTLRR